VTRSYVSRSFFAVLEFIGYASGYLLRGILVYQPVRFKLGGRPVSLRSFER